MFQFLAPLALLASAQSAAPLPADTASPTPLPIEQQTALRCSVAIAMAAEQQRAGQAQGKDWPVLGERGREFFVRSLAKLMDAAGLTREDLGRRVQFEMEGLRQPGVHDAVMPGCLMLLDASGA